VRFTVVRNSTLAALQDDARLWRARAEAAERQEHRLVSQIRAVQMAISELPENLKRKITARLNRGKT